MDSISLTFKKLLHVVCITGMDKGKGIDAIVWQWCIRGKIPFFIWVLCHRFLEMERTKKVIEGPGEDRSATFSWKDDVTNQKSSSKNTSTLISNEIIKCFLSYCIGNLFIPMVSPPAIS